MVGGIIKKKGLAMRFLRWLFDIGRRHRREVLSYEKGKVSGRVTAIVLMFVFMIISVGLELLTFKLFSGSFGWGLLSAIFTVALAVATVETAGVYAYCGFKYYVLGSVGKLVSRVAKDKGDDFLYSEIADETNKRCHKKVDLAVGILGIIVAVGTIVVMVALLIARFNMLIHGA